MTATTQIFNRAPKGGMVSPVNGRAYKGGQFMPAAPVAVETRTWFIRPTTVGGVRRFTAVAKSATGAETTLETTAGGVYLFRAVSEAREHIATYFQGGRAFPAPRPRVDPFSSDVETIRNRHRFAAIGIPPAFRA
jgi:hypothetical protein